MFRPFKCVYEKYIPSLITLGANDKYTVVENRKLGDKQNASFQVDLIV